MAKLSAHGRTAIGTVYFTTSAKRYMSDGTILKNQGFGWKVSGKVKTGTTPLEAFSRQESKTREVLATHPARAAYRKALHNIAGLSKRWKLHTAVSLMPDDCDAVWSEACDGYGENCHADIDEISKLCDLYKAAMSEQDRIASNGDTEN